MQSHPHFIHHWRRPRGRVEGHMLRGPNPLGAVGAQGEDAMADLITAVSQGGAQSG